MTVLAKAYRSDRRSVTPGCRFAGLPSAADAYLSAETRSGSTPRNGAGSMATDTACETAPSENLRQQPAEGVPNDGWLLSQGADDRGEGVGDLADGLACERLEMRTGLRGRLGVVGPPVCQCTHPAVSNRSAQRSQLLDSRHRPWTKTAGARPEAFARPICPAAMLGSQRRADELIGGHEYSSFSAGDTCPGVWTLPRHTLSASNDRVRVCGIPSRYPAFPARAPWGSSFGRAVTRPLRLDFEVDYTTSGAASGAR